jgi:hypothetical protein
MHSEGDKLHMKIVSFIWIYNFVVQTFSLEIIFRLR